jgi:hypothetical protein
MPNDDDAATARRSPTGLKRTIQTTEFIAYAVTVLLVVLTALFVGNDEGGSPADPFSAEDALRYITFLTIGYVISRGLAKSGRRGGYDRD